MKLYFEKVAPPDGSSFSAVEFAGKAFVCPFHYHPEIELTFIKSSTGRRFVGDHIGRFGPNDLVLIGSGTPHMYFDDPPPHAREDWAQSIVIQFDPEIWGPAFWEAPELSGIRKMLRDAIRGLKFSGKTVEQAAELMEALCHCHGPIGIEKLINLWILLENSSERTFLSSEGYSRPRDETLDQRIHKAYALINERFHQSLTQKEVARELNMSPSTFSRFFRNTSGKTFKRFLNEVRIAQVCQRLQISDERVLEICYGCGFSNLSNFNRRFLEHTNLTPTQYRQKYSNEGQTQSAFPPSFEKSRGFKSSDAF